MKEIHYWDELPDASDFDVGPEVLARRNQKRHERAFAQQERIADLKSRERPVPERLYEIIDRTEMSSDDDYRRFFECRFSQAQTAIDPTPGMLFLNPSTWDRMRAQFPKTKVLIILRNPADAVYARVLHRSRIGDLGKDPMTAVLEKIVNTAYSGHDGSRIGTAPLRYSEISQQFGSDCVHHVFFEDIFSDKQDETLQGICDFAGIKRTDPNPFIFTKKKTEYAPLPSRYRRLLTLLFANHYRYADRAGLTLPNAWEQDRQDFLTLTKDKAL